MLIDRPIASPDLSAYARHAPRLLDMGYVVIPCRPGSKVPGQVHVTPKGEIQWINRLKWNEEFLHRPPTQEEVEAFCDLPGGPGLNLLTGRVGGNEVGLAVFDIDANPDKLSEAYDVQSAILECLPPTHVGKVGAIGESLFYSVPVGCALSSRQYSIRGIRVLDVLFDTTEGKAKQTVIPPTIHPDTNRPYRWSRDETLETTALDELPPIDESVLEPIERALERFGWQRAHNPVARAPGARLDTGAATPHRSLNDHALANLDSWVPKLNLYNVRRTPRGFDAVPYWRPNAKGLRLEERQRSLSIHALGIRDMSADEGYTALDLCMKALACDLDTAFAFLARSTGWSGDVPDVHIDLASLTAPLVIRDPEPAAAVPVPVAVKSPAVVAEDLVQDLTRVPGLIGEIVDWIEASAESPSRELALGAALVVLATLMGRRWAGPTRSAVHLYVALIGPTASGKDWPQTCASRLLAAAGAGHLQGADDFYSASAAYQDLHRKPLQAMIVDELGNAIARMNNKKASTHEQGIRKFLQTVWGRSFEQVRSPSWVGKKELVVNAPAFSLLGGSTVEQLLGAFANEDVENGMLNRFLFLRLWEYPPDVSPSAAKEVPTWLARKLAAIYGSDTPEGLLATVVLSDPKTMPPIKEVPFADEAAREIYMRHRRSCRDRQRTDKEAAAFLGRTAEMALRMATIRAVSLEPLEPSIEAEDIEWGIAVAEKSASTMMHGAKAILGATETQKIADRIMETVRLKPEGISHRDLHRKLGQKWPSKTFAEIVKGLHQDAELLKITRVARADGSRVDLWYTAEEA